MVTNYNGNTYRIAFVIAFHLHALRHNSLLCGEKIVLKLKRLILHTSFPGSEDCVLLNTREENGVYLQIFYAIIYKFYSQQSCVWGSRSTLLKVLKPNDFHLTVDELTLNHRALLLIICI